MGNLNNMYLYKALDSFPYDLEETIEALNYALSYDEKDTLALTLMGRVYAEKLMDYNKAIDFFEEAIASNPNALEIYPGFINVLLWNEDFDKASKVIAFALSLKGTDKGKLFYQKAILHEYQMQYKAALKALKKAKVYTYNSCFMETLNSEKERIKSKMETPKKKKSKKKAEKKKVKKNGAK